MDNNNVNTPQVPNIPNPQPVVTQVSEPQKGSKKLLLVFIIGILIIGLLVVGIYFILGRQTSSNVINQEANPPQIPTQVPQENLESGLENISIDDSAIDNDFSAIDQDLQQL